MSKTLLQSASRLVLATLFLSSAGRALANPAGGQVVLGNAAIGQTSPTTLQVDQKTKVVIVNWSSFNIAKGETTRFKQPGADALAVNRIGGGSPSQILGSLLANGRVVLINGDGIVFGPNARINTGSFLATTSDASNADIASGRATFDRPGNPSAMIVNQGTINATGGMVGLIAPAVRNDGIVSARLGSVTLGASNVFTVDFTGDGLISFPLDPNVVAKAIDAHGKPVEALVVNNGRIEGATVLLSARAARDLVTNVISMGGKIAATAVHQQGGNVVLDGGSGGVSVTGTITASGNTGGNVAIAGNTIALKGAIVDASGTNGGGTITVGGWSTASVTADASTILDASATASGNGGHISYIGALSHFFGTIKATGGTSGGDGGSVETSGHTLDIDGARVDTSAPKGKNGSWLLDPDDYTIDNIAAATIATNLTSGDVTIQTTATGTGGNGDVFVNAPVSWSSANSLTLSAYRNIAVNANLTNTGGAAVNLHADNTGTGIGTVSFPGGAAVSTSGAVSIFYNPSVNPAGSIVNTTSYVSPTENFSGNIAGGGSLTAYMLVNSVYDLQNIQNNLTGTYALGRDIDASETASWNGGQGFYPIIFDGTFDGQGHTISGLTIDRPSTNSIGLFGVTNGEIRNVGLVGGSIAGRSDVGALAGINGGTITQSYASVTVSGTTFVGGLVGESEGAPIVDSYATGAVNGTTAAGGLVGFLSHSGSAVRSYATGTVTGVNQVGGLVGESYGDSVVSQSYATGVVNGTSEVGGLVGANTQGSITQSYATGAVSGATYVGGLTGSNGSLIATIAQSYATGAVTGTTDVGGLVGINYASNTIMQSYWDAQTSGQSNSVGSGDAGGSTGLTSAQARTQSSYVGWDFSNDWFMIDGETRPFGRWEYSTTITNAHQLQLMAMDLTASYTLANDIDLGPALAADANGNYPGMWGAAGFVPVGTITGTWDDPVGAFTGTFDGQGNVISDMIISRSAADYVGLFGYVNAGFVHDIGFLGGSVTGRSYVGELAGVNSGTITYSHASGAINGGGGLVGWNKGTISQSYATGTVSGGGGLAVQNSGTIAQSYATGTVIGGGGLVSVNYWTGTITQSFATGAVNGEGVVGGLVGLNYGTVSQSYATGTANGAATLDGTSEVGGLVGENDGTITQSYATGAFSSEGGLAGGLVGSNYSQGRIMWSYASGKSSGNNWEVGGLAGFNSGVITQSYATGALNARAADIGGLVGANAGGTITQSYWDTQTTGKVIGVGSGSALGTTGLTSAQARTQSSYVGWDFTSDWFMIEGETRPFGRWEYSTTIANAHQLQLMAMDLIANYTLANDIDLSPALAADANGNYPGMWGASGFVPVGNDILAFSGAFSGAEHAISNLIIDRPSSDYVGLFGYSTGAIGDVGLTGGSIAGRNSVGVLVGGNYGGTINNAYTTGSVSGNNSVGGLAGFSYGAITDTYASGTVQGGGSYAGGLVGLNGAAISNSYASGAVSGGAWVGGLVGSNSASLTDVYATGTVQGSGQVGGLVGMHSAGTVSNAYASGAVTGQSWVGGLIGEVSGGTIHNAYALGSITGGDWVGGLVGVNYGTIGVTYSSGLVSGGSYVGGLAGASNNAISQSYWDTETSGQSAGVGSGDASGVTGLTSAQARTQSSYAGWDFTNDWFMIDGETRPFGRWEYSTTITNAHQLQLMAMDLTASYTLANDIDLGPALAADANGDYSGMWDAAGFVPVGSYTASTFFSGSFDGRNHTINDLTIYRPTSADVGLFGIVEYAEITNIGLIGGSVTGAGSVGALAGVTNNSVTISDSYASVAVSGNQAVGGLIGASDGTTISRSYATGTVTGVELPGVPGTTPVSEFIGGLVGLMTHAGMVTRSFAAGAVSGDQLIGGLVGGLETHIASISQSYATGIVSGTSYVGGFVGYTNSPITESYSSGTVSGTSYTGGFIGYVDATVADSYWDTQSSGQSSGVGFGDASGVTGLTTAQFQNGALPSGFDIAVWAAKAGFYPCLLWQSGCFATGPSLTSVTYSVADASSTYGTLATLGAVTLTGVPAGDATNVAGVVTLYDSSNGAVALSDALNAGLYTEKVTSLTGSAAPNYTIAAAGNHDGTLTINPAPLAVAVNGASRVYGDANPVFSATITGFVLGQDASVISGLTFSTTATTASDIGNYAITSSGGTAANYIITNRTDGTLIVTARPITVTADDLSRVYGDANPPLTYSLTAGTLVNGDTLTGGLATTATASSDVGTYAITQGSLTASANYTLSFVPGTLTINPSPSIVTVTYSVADASSTYGTLATLGAVTLTGVSAGDTGNVAGIVMLYDSSNGAVALSDALNAGLYTEKVTSLAGSAAPGYTIAATGNHDGTLAINPAPLAVAVNSASRVYGDANPAFGATITGFVLGQDASVVTGLTFSTTATTASGIGNYAITSSGGTAANYIITSRTDGTLTVTARPITVTADDLSRVYGDANPPLTWSLIAGSLVNGDTLTGGPATTATPASNVGTYVISQSTLAASANYTLTFDPGTLTVTARPVTTAADDLSRVYGDANPPLTYSLIAGSLVNGDMLSGSLTTAATATSNVGSYAITQGTLAASNNYALTFDPGTLTVAPAPLTLVVADASRYFLAPNPPFLVAISGFKLGQDASLVSGLSVSTTANLFSLPGTYPIVAIGGTAPNYIIASRFDGTLTIERRVNPRALGVMSTLNLLGALGRSGELTGFDWQLLRWFELFDIEQLLIANDNNIACLISSELGDCHASATTDGTNTVVRKFTSDRPPQPAAVSQKG